MKNKFIAALAIAIGFSAAQANAQTAGTKTATPAKQEQAAKPAPTQMKENKHVSEHKSHAKGKKTHHAHTTSAKEKVKS